MTLRLHHAPLACSLASRLALLEAGLEHEIAFVHTTRGEHLTQAYGRINPRRKVPALETAQGVITESTAILPYIADQAPERALLPPPGGYERAIAQSWLSFISSSVHTAFSGVMGAERFATDPAGVEAVRAGHLGLLAGALGVLDAHLADREFMLDAFSVCDLYLLVFLIWRAGPATAGRLPTLPNLDAFQQRMLARPGLMAVLGEEMKLRAEAV
ncbi:glutathione S-transferase family protein [Phenylobacterium sp.]|uniref:glutathione S-transferase family protein n=1 Tax=Phenylobacterium sp. TaxID=1871053 RepID=UPI002732FCCE|nr:glutathione S-transferase N-terminal domain-containing protein [Phenylobacterium sp.]MDP3855767.1 glutathione S-transferase N-terminal domain-containing protein [Phenylobacterium sp.]